MIRHRSFAIARKEGQTMADKTTDSTVDATTSRVNTTLSGIILIARVNTIAPFVTFTLSGIIVSLAPLRTTLLLHVSRKMSWKGPKQSL